MISGIKTLYTNFLTQNNLRHKILENQEVKIKYQIWVERKASV